MEKGVYWAVFETIGSIEAYLTYCKADEIFSDSSADSNVVEEKDVDGD
ncbi:hypothetical protein GF312_11355 [Candidatus Poribacteria bacterium]|nr:hypothetical protein [Candidatus Poribacteria bacterium]